MNYVPDALDFRYMLFDYYKKIGMSEDQLAVIMMIDHLLQQGNSLVTAELLALKMNYSVEQIDKMLVALLNKGLLDYASDHGEMKTNILPLKKRLYREFQIDLARQQSEQNPHLQSQLQNVLQVFQTELGRSLSPVEVQRVQEWFVYGYSEKMIVDALKEALKKNRRSIRSIDKILLQWSIAEDVAAEGYSAHADQYKKDISSTIDQTTATLRQDE